MKVGVFDMNKKVWLEGIEERLVGCKLGEERYYNDKYDLCYEVECDDCTEFCMTYLDDRDIKDCTEYMSDKILLVDMIEINEEIVLRLMFEHIDGIEVLHVMYIC